MKKTIYIVTFLLITVSLHARTRKQDFVQNYNHLFKVTQATTFNLVNKFGDINIKNWEKNEVKVDVKITVTAKNQDKADKVFKSIKINFSEEKDLISAITEIEEQTHIVIVGIGNTYTSYKIDYDVYVPVYMKFDLKNKYGNTYISELHSRSNFNIKYGDLKAENLVFPDTKPYSKITIKYGNVNIKTVSWCTIIAKYSDLKIEHSTALILLSKYSEYKIGESIAIVTDSKYDEFDITKIGNFVFTGSYTDVVIDKLYSQLVLDSKFGSLKVGKISNKLQKVRIVAEYTDVKIGVSDKAEFTISGTADFGDIDFDNIKTVDVTEETTRTFAKGYFNDKSSKNRLTFVLKFGDIHMYAE